MGGYEDIQAIIPRPANKNRNARSALNQRRMCVERKAKSTEAVDFFNILTSKELLQTTEALLPEHRERLYPPTVTLLMFMRQTLETDGSCQKAVNMWTRASSASSTPCSYGQNGPHARCRLRQACSR
jgi:hypothetical protein